jgi:hypothetical protein
LSLKPSSIAPINGSKGSGTCKLSACSRQPVQPHLLASCYWVPVLPGGKYKPSQSCNQTLRKESAQSFSTQFKPTTSTYHFNPVFQLRTSTNKSTTKQPQNAASCLNRSLSPYWHWQPSGRPTPRSPRLLRTLLRLALRRCVQTSSTAAGRHTAAVTQPVMASPRLHSRTQVARQQPNRRQTPRLHQSPPLAS